ncbi:MAG: hypothetical protein MI700_03995 [Balneolales bacterium]|nr:hypothetical protein [Balneolales bacterium]
MFRILILSIFLCTNLLAQPTPTEEIDAFWKEASRTVKEGDYLGYSATFHEEAILVNGISGNSYPIQTALDGWQQGFDDTKFGVMEAGVEFRFSERFHGAEAAHDVGIFRYFSQKDGEEPQEVFIHFEALLTKSTGTWTVLMEYQKSIASQEEWDALE